MSIVIRMAEQADAEIVVGLLTGAGVQTGGVVDNIGHFLLVEAETEDGLQAVGTVGLEVYEQKYGVMRSLIMRQGSWNANVGVELLRLFFAYAQTQGIEALYLLTKSTGQDYFIHMGFSTARPEEIPPAVAASQHFRAYQAEQVIAMVKRYESTTYPHPSVDIVGN